jgi:hypothetical protein
MSRTLEDADIAAIALLLSPERLANLKTLTESTRIAIELHQETLALSSNLMNVIASVELALRNTVCENLTAFFGAPGWLTHPPAPFQWRKTENENAKRALDSAQRATYSKMNQTEKAALDATAFPHGRPPNTTHLQRAVKRRRQITVTDGKIIAETTFHFWKRLYSPDYDQKLWRTTLKRTFPNKRMKRPQIAENLEHIYQARNRLAHHEPVLHKRFDDTVAAIEFTSENMNAVTASKDTPLAKLIADDLDQVKDKAQRLHARLASFRQQP